MIITGIEPQKRKPNRRSIFVDGVYAFGLHEEELPRLKLFLGMELTQAQLSKLLTEVVYVNARDTALRYLGSRPRTAAETLKRLEEDKYPPDIIVRVMRLLEKYRYINDKQYASDYALSRMKSGKYGLYRIRRELKQKGVCEDYIEEALRNAEEVHDPVISVLACLKRKQPDPQHWKEKKRVIDGLMRSGFSYGVIKEAFALYEHEVGNAGQE